MRLTFLSSLISYVLFLIIQDFSGPISVYLFFVFNAFTLCAFTVKEFSRTVFYQIKYKNQYLLGLSAILLIYLIQFNVTYTITGIMVLLFIGYYKLNKLRLQW